MNINDLIEILKASIAPVALISGIGLLLLSMVNRLSRTLDRIRFLCSELERALEVDVPILKKQITILYRRCQDLRSSILLSIVCISCVSLVVLILFLMKILNINLTLLVEIIFAIAIITLVCSLIYFLKDVFAALKSVKIEIERVEGKLQSSKGQ